MDKIILLKVKITKGKFKDTKCLLCDQITTSCYYIYLHDNIIIQICRYCFDKLDKNKQ